MNVVEMIPILITSASVFAVIAYAIYLEFRKKKLLSDQVMALIEKGGQVPDLQALIPRPNYVRRGYMLMGFGIALTLALAMNVSFASGAWGLLFIGLGGAYLLAEKTSETRP